MRNGLERNLLKRCDLETLIQTAALVSFLQVPKTEASLNVSLTTKTLAAARVLAGVDVMELARESALNPLRIACAMKGDETALDREERLVLRMVLEEYGVEFGAGGWIRRKQISVDGAPIGLAPPGNQD